MVAGAIFGLALCWIFATPRKYDSHASILVQNARSNVLITAGNTSGPTEMKDITEEELNSELEVLTSRDMLDEVCSRAGAGRRGRAIRRQSCKTTKRLWKVYRGAWMQAGAQITCAGGYDHRNARGGAGSSCGA